MTPAALREQCRRILGWDTPLGFFPVRHHSPTCARHLETFLREFRPDLVLIEGPAAFNEHIALLADPEHEAPFALVAGVRAAGEMRVRSYYPMCDYSPELVALRVARELGAQPRFIDLVSGEGRRYRDPEDEPAAGEPAEPEDEGDSAAAPAGAGASPSGSGTATPAGAGTPPGERLAAEDSALARSRFTQELITRSGARDFEEMWEILFEQGGWDKPHPDWALEVAVYSWLSRAGYREDELEADGTLEREQVMAWHIATAAGVEQSKPARKSKKKAAEEAEEGTAAAEAALAASGKKIAVITGAFHTVALRRTAAEPPPKAVKGASAEVFLAPYTFPRLDALLGYASGMAGPQFYQHVWQARQQPEPFAEAARQVLVEATRLARSDGEVLGTADAISAVAFARSLAGFRGRLHVGRSEVLEAAGSCFVKGDALLVGQRVMRALGEVLRGSKVGKLGPSAGESPLVQDFRQRCQKLRFVIQHGRPEAKELAIFGSELDLERSRFFHQCTFLGLGFCTWRRGPDLVTGTDLHLTVEHWNLQYAPEVDTRLVEHSHLGATVEDAAAAQLVRAWAEAEGRSGELSLLLVRGLAMGLHRAVARLVPRLAASMFGDDDVISLLEAGGRLRTVLRGRERLAGLQVEGLPVLARQAFLQAALRLERLAGITPDRLSGGLSALAGLLDVVLTDTALAPDRELLLQHARMAREAARLKAPAVMGALDGFLLQMGELELPAMAKTLTILGRGKTLIDGVGSYLEGVLGVARQALLVEGGLLDALLVHVRDAEWPDFMAALPSLRRALTQLTPRETESVAHKAAELFGISAADAVQLFTVSPEVVARLGAWEQQVLEDEAAWAG